MELSKRGPKVNMSYSIAFVTCYKQTRIFCAICDSTLATVLETFFIQLIVNFSQ